MKLLLHSFEAFPFFLVAMCIMDQGILQLTKHPWFKDIDWEKLQERKIAPRKSLFIEDDYWLLLFFQVKNSDNNLEETD